MSTSTLLDDQQYPHRWNEYIGQTRAKESLKVAAKSARMRKAPLEHTLIADPQPGVGKTALAVLTCAEMRREATVVSGPMNDNKARWLFAQMKDGDILVCEEFHRMFEGNKKSWAWLLNYMQDGQIMGPLGMEPQPRVTIIATTTEAGIVPPTVAGRFMIRPTLVNYSEVEAGKIAQRMAVNILGPELPALGRRDAMILARGAAHNPRHIRSLLTVLRDLVVTGTIGVNGHYDVRALLEWEGITDDGLSPVAQRYLVILASELQGTAGERALVDRLQHAGGLNSVEDLLLSRGLVARTRTGRALTQAGIKRAQELLALSGRTAA